MENPWKTHGKPYKTRFTSHPSLFLLQWRQLHGPGGAEDPREVTEEDLTGPRAALGLFGMQGAYLGEPKGLGHPKTIKNPVFW